MGLTARSFSEGLEPSRAAIVERLVEIIGSLPQPLDMGVKWGRLTFALEGDFHHWICGIAATKRAVVLELHFGGLLDDPDGRLIAGTSRFLRKLEYRSADEVDAAVVIGLLTQALERLPTFKASWRTIATSTTRAGE